jgi:hypothetical protein
MHYKESLIQYKVLTGIVNSKFIAVFSVVSLILINYVNSVCKCNM